MQNYKNYPNYCAHSGKSLYFCRMKIRKRPFLRLFALLAALFFVVVGAAAVPYTVETVPNVQLADRSRHVSNPDGVLSAETQARLDAMLRQLRDSTSAEVEVVAVNDISADAVLGTLWYLLF